MTCCSRVRTTPSAPARTPAAAPCVPSILVVAVAIDDVVGCDAVIAIRQEHLPNAVVLVRREVAALTCPDRGPRLLHFVVEAIQVVDDLRERCDVRLQQTLVLIRHDRHCEYVRCSR